MDSSPKAPATPDPAKTYEQGIQLDIKYLPQILQAEQDARATYDPQSIQHQQDLQSQFGPQQYQQQLDAFNQLDPTYLAAHDQLGSNIYDQLKLGTTVDQSTQDQIAQATRAAQSARGNLYGNAPATAEAYAIGDRGQQLQQQRTQNALGFMAAPTIASQVNQIQPVSADRTAAFANPNSGFMGQNFALQNYQNMLGAQGLNQSAGNPWASALGGAASGATTGASLGGGYGALIGGVAGGVGGYLSSDRRLKERVMWVGRYDNGLNKFEFNYKGQTRRRTGVLSEEVRLKFPEAVTQDARGFDIVDYDRIGVKMEDV